MAKTRAELEQQVAALRTKWGEQHKSSQEAIDIKTLEEHLVLGTLVEKHGELGREIRAVFSPSTGEMIVVKRPSRAAFDEYQATVTSVQLGRLGKDDLKRAMVQLVQPHRIYPEPQQYGALLDSTPAMLSKCVNACSEMAGAKLEEDEGK